MEVIRESFPFFSLSLSLFYQMSSFVLYISSGSVKAFLANMSYAVKKEEKKYCLELRSTHENERIEIGGHPPMDEHSASRFFFYILCQLLNPDHVLNH